MSMHQSWHGRRWRASGWNWMGLEINGKRGGEEERDKKGKRRGHTMTLTNCGDLVSKVSSLCQSTTSHTGFCISPINSNQLQSLVMYSDILHIALHVLDSTDYAMLHYPWY